MDRWLKGLHLVGMALFLGSIPGHVILGFAQPGGEIPAPGIVFAREMVKIATLFVTTPGLVLAVVTGFAMVAVRRVDVRAQPWLLAHLVLGLVMLANASLLIVPTELALVEQAHVLLDGGSFDPQAWARIKMTEDIAGAANVLMALVSIGLGVARPWRRQMVPAGD